MKIVALAGGVGGAKLADGLAQVLGPGDLTIVVNTGDDFEHFGLHISPDLDTVCYTLAGLANPDTGWGRRDETWQAISSAAALGGPAWFHLGDRDLGTHLERTRLLDASLPLSKITADFCTAWGVRHAVLPMSDQPVRTIVKTDQGELAFQEYFVRQRCEPAVKGFEFRGASDAVAAPGVLDALERADAVVICPSNPWVSISPILAIPGVRDAVKRTPAVAVSPIIGGAAVRGPAAKMYAEMGISPSALAVAAQYQGLAQGFVLDSVDSELRGAVSRYMDCVLVTHTLMQSPHDRKRLAEDVLDFIGANFQ
ncbi:MAG TPA: 2-phospho-L-lactate transferase [Anaerolineales bacterium]|nr:2-phospho-L-lactate transferase [Anaerolineales bacterium]